MNQLQDELNKVCCICLEEETDNKKNALIEYKHCGNYYVHNKCLNKWKYDECLICRKNFLNLDEESQLSSENITILQHYNNSVVTPYKYVFFKCCFIFMFGIVGTYYIIKYENELNN
jgi:hypothetical protein